MDNELGFYFMIFQPDNSRNRVKYWLDGEKAYNFMRFDVFKRLVPSAMEIIFNLALRESSIFLWDVAESKIRRLHFTGDEPPLSDWIRAKKTQNAKEEPRDGTHEQMWKHRVVEMPDGSVQIIRE